VAGQEPAGSPCISPPTSCSWLNLVECFFSIITRQSHPPRRLQFRCDLTTAIDAYIDGWNEQAAPFT
jgi:hypothetical protein